MAVQDPSPPPSERILLAELALAAALSVDGVLDADPGPRGLHVLRSGDRSIDGADVIAEAGGRYTITLGLRARLTGLPALADTIRVRIARSARLAGLEDRVGHIDVTFHDLVEPGA